eukprot:m.200730 g.200730  ORF g.200730 m.200730 type:complete len:57 (-) comp17055_c0_seq2:146-316(-)
MVLAMMVAVVGLTATGSALATRAVVVGLLVPVGCDCDVLVLVAAVLCFGSAIVTTT